MPQTQMKTDAFRATYADLRRQLDELNEQETTLQAKVDAAAYSGDGVFGGVQVGSEAAYSDAQKLLTQVQAARAKLSKFLNGAAASYHAMVRDQVQGSADLNAAGHSAGGAGSGASAGSTVSRQASSGTTTTDSENFQ